MRKTTPQKEHDGEDWGSTHGLLKLQWSLQWLRGGIQSFKLTGPSSSSDFYEQGGPPLNKQVTVGLIMDCPTITVHAGKCYKTVIDLGAAISLIRYSTYQSINISLKTPIQATTTKLNMAGGSLMTALGMMALHLRIIDFKITHTFVVCNRLPDTKILFGIDIQKFLLFCSWDKEKKCYIQRDSRFLTYIRNWTEVNNMNCQVSSQMPPRHNGVIPIKIKGHEIKRHTAYFISNEDSTKGKDPNINIKNGILNINGKTSVNILVSNYTNKPVTANKGEYIGHLEITMEEIPQTTEKPDVPTTHSITIEKMTSEKVEPDTFQPPHHKLNNILKQDLQHY